MHYSILYPGTHSHFLILEVYITYYIDFVKTQIHLQVYYLSKNVLIFTK